MKKPLDPAVDGRDKGGRFAPGNRAGLGNPLAGKAAKLRAALFECVTVKDLKAIVLSLVDAAKAGDTIAAREILDRTIGKPSPTELLQRIEALEQAAAERQNNAA